GEVLLEPGVLAQRGWDRDAPLLVRHLVGRAGEEDAQVVPRLPARDRCLAELVVHALELRDGEDVEAALLAPREDEPRRELVPELRGQDEPALVVQARSVGAEEHGDTPFADHSATSSHHITPLPSP